MKLILIPIVSKIISCRVKYNSYISILSFSNKALCYRTVWYFCHWEWRLASSPVSTRQCACIQLICPIRLRVILYRNPLTTQFHQWSVLGLSWTQIGSQSGWQSVWPNWTEEILESFRVWKVQPSQTAKIFCSFRCVAVIFQNGGIQL